MEPGNLLSDASKDMIGGNVAQTHSPTTLCKDDPRYHYNISGGYSDVYPGALLNGAKVAIKSLRVYTSSEVNMDQERQKLLKRAARELSHWSKLQHRNILPLMGLAIYRGFICMISEWIQYGNLMCYLRQNPEADRMKLCLDVCQGLCYIHSNEMVHGDLKGANIMVTSDGTALIADFGNARMRDLTVRFTNVSAPGFSVRWVAPELLRNDDGPQVSKEADVYAYAMTVLETLTGQPPYQGISEHRVMMLISEKKTPSRPHPDTNISDNLWRLLNACWAQKPSKRPSAEGIERYLHELVSTKGRVYDDGEEPEESSGVALALRRASQSASTSALALKRSFQLPWATVSDLRPWPGGMTADGRSALTAPNPNTRLMDSSAPRFLAETFNSVPLAQLPVARDIPTTISASFTQWWRSNANQSALSEERLFRRLPFFHAANDTAPTEGVVGRLSTVELSGKGRFVNMFTISPVESGDKQVSTSTSVPPAIVLPDYGAGIGFFYQNFPALGEWASKRNTNVYALDWIGMGRSARVPFKVNAKREDIKGRVEEAESFFLDALEEWREKMGVEKMSLVGHGLGAYLSAVYALRYPARVNQVILLSPAGVPRDPNTTEEPSHELDLTPAQGGTTNGGTLTTTDARVKDVKDQQRQAKREETTLRKVATYLWEEGWSPFQIVRSAAFYGPWLVGKYSRRRFDLTDEDKRDMHDYIWHITRAKGSGEYCISHLLAPGAHARRPLVDRINALRVPLTFVYGDHDWMDPEGGKASLEELKRAGNFASRMFMIQGAGHHVYLDNVKAVNKLIVNELDRALDLN